MLDRAEGILVGLRRCRVESAFDEIVGASQQHVAPALRVARALVELAEGHEPPTSMPPPVKSGVTCCPRRHDAVMVSRGPSRLSAPA